MLLEREQYWIDTLNACKNGYNIAPTAGSSLGIKRTETFKRKVAENSKLHKHTEESKKKMSTLKKGNKYSLGSVRTDKEKLNLSKLRSGIKNPSAKLTLEMVLQIKTELSIGVPQQKIANKYKISQTQVSKINTGKKWKIINEGN